MRIGLVPGSFKPYHAGHDGLVAIASRENDAVKLFVSLGDRVKPGEFPLYGKRMREVWDKYLKDAIERTYPNVEVIYATKAPVTHVYEELKLGDGGDDEYVIYSDDEDILKYTDVTLMKAAPNLFADGMITRRGVKRTETVNISGTYMRGLLAAGETEEFSQLLPASVRKNAQEILDILRGTTMGESLLRTYIQLLLI